MKHNDHSKLKEFFKRSRLFQNSTDSFKSKNFMGRHNTKLISNLRNNSLIKSNSANIKKPYEIYSVLQAKKIPNILRAIRQSPLMGCQILIKGYKKEHKRPLHKSMDVTIKLQPDIRVKKLGMEPFWESNEGHLVRKLILLGKRSYSFLKKPVACSIALRKVLVDRNKSYIYKREDSGNLNRLVGMSIFDLKNKLLTKAKLSPVREHNETPSLNNDYKFFRKCKILPQLIDKATIQKELPSKTHTQIQSEKEAVKIDKSDIKLCEFKVFVRLKNSTTQGNYESFDNDVNIQ